MYYIIYSNFVNVIVCQCHFSWDSQWHCFGLEDVVLHAAEVFTCFSSFLSAKINFFRYFNFYPSNFTLHLTLNMWIDLGFWWDNTLTSLTIHNLLIGIWHFPERRASFGRHEAGGERKQLGAEEGGRRRAVRLRLQHPRQPRIRVFLQVDLHHESVETLHGKHLRRNSVWR